MNKKEIYEAELFHRVVAVYLYLKDRANKEGTCYPAIGNYCKETESVCQYCKMCYQRFGGERIYTQETTLA